MRVFRVRQLRKPWLKASAGNADCGLPTYVGLEDCGLLMSTDYDNCEVSRCIDSDDRGLLMYIGCQILGCRCAPVLRLVDCRRASAVKIAGRSAMG